MGYFFSRKFCICIYGKNYTATIKDISEGGALLLTKAPIQEGETGTIVTDNVENGEQECEGRWSKRTLRGKQVGVQFL